MLGLPRGRPVKRVNVETVRREGILGWVWTVEGLTTWTK
jgi:hypothetical protein